MLDEFEVMLCFRLPIVVLTILLFSSASWGQLLTRLTDGKESSVTGAVIFGKTPVRSANMTLHLRAKHRPTILVISRNGKGVLNLFTPYQGKRLTLPVVFSEGFEGISQNGRLEKGFFVQAAEYDITGDKEPEIVIAVGDSLVNLEVNIFQYQSPKDGKGVGSWKRIGSFSGQSKAVVEGNSIFLPYGSQGLFEQHQWKANRFAKVN